MAYPVAGAVGGLIPSNRDWHPPERGIALFVESNGVHTGIVVPKVSAVVDWREVFAASDLADPRYGAYDYIVIGWGERDFYLKTKTWWDVRPTTIAAAATGSEATLIHAEHIPRPTPGADTRMLIVRPAEYRRLADYIRASLRAGGAHHPGYGDYDVFYDARGHYSGIETCNAWTGDALRHAGIRIGAWTPFPSTVLRWFDQSPGR